jgi:hypothetical protein
MTRSGTAHAAIPDRVDETKLSQSYDNKKEVDSTCVLGLLFTFVPGA